jgi:hypothetical protein
VHQANKNGIRALTKAKQINDEVKPSITGTPAISEGVKLALGCLEG